MATRAKLIGLLEVFRQRFDEAAREDAFGVYRSEDKDGPSIGASRTPKRFIALARDVEPLLAEADATYDAKRGQTAAGRLLYWVFGNAPTDSLTWDEEDPIVEFADNPYRMTALAIHKLTAQLAVVADGERTDAAPVTSGGRADTATDKKPRNKKRVLTAEARACGLAYRRALASGDKRSRKYFCQDWTAENGHKYKNLAGQKPSWATIDKALQEHPEAWKPAADTADKSADTEV